MNGRKGDQIGAVSGSCKLHKESLSPDLLKQLNTTGVAVIPLDEHLRMTGKLSLKACQQYAIADFEQNVILLDTGHAKLMTPFSRWKRSGKFPDWKTPGLKTLMPAARATPCGTWACPPEMTP